ncbi:MAG TPA: homogentisate 1,2-dioxygenase [Mycobacteriales bacterium]|nr:homogentisate 1,2-dioxygenase [Mycobacteriales bacterium]
MPYYRSVGRIPRKRHTQFRRPDGGLYAEELMGAEGFTADSALLYHEHLPTAIVNSQPYAGPPETRTPNLPLKPRHLRTHELDFPGLDPHGEAGKGSTAEVDPITGRRPLLANSDVRLSYCAAGAPSPLYRNATGDECVYIENGTARFESVFGGFELGQGDYLIVPASTTYRLVPTGVPPLRTYVIEATGHIGPARRYLTARGQFTEHSPYCERDLRGPVEPLRADVEDCEDVEVLVRHRQGWTRLTYAHHPFDVVGWDGCLYPYAVNVADFEPLTGRVHQPPPVHQIFEGPNFVVCNFVPRKVDYHPLAIPVPYNHANVDSDEVMFYCAGSYAARSGSGIGQGSISLHPAGFTHGPQPGSVERALGVEHVDELAVMVDTFRPLDLCDAGLACEDAGYAWTWAGRHLSRPAAADQTG